LSLWEVIITEVTTTQALKLFTGDFEFSVLSIGMMVARIKKKYINEPTPEVLEICTSELKTINKKYDEMISHDKVILNAL
jgi:hypothetical protein